MLFLVGLDLSVLGIAVLWHGLIQQASPMFWFGFMVIAIGNGLLMHEKNLRDEKR